MRRRRERTFLEGLPVLVLDGHSRAALETVQSLGRRGARVRVAASGPRALAFRSRWAAKRILQPRSGPELARWLEAEVAARDPALVVPATETSLLALRTLGSDRPARARAVLPGDEALDTFLDKERTRLLAERVGVPVPATRSIAAGASELPGAWPVVLKPTRSKVVVGGEVRALAPVIVRDEASWREALAGFDGLVEVQEQAYVAGKGVGVEVLYERGQLRWAFAHERQHELPLTGGGSSWRTSLAVPDDLLAASRALLDPLAWHGVAMVEFKRAPDGSFCLMEVNPRLWGSLALAIDAGVDFPLGLALLATGRDVGPSPPYRVPCGTRSLPEEVEWQKANLRADHGDPLLLTRPRVRSVVELAGLLGARQHLDHASWKDPRPVRDQVVEALGGVGRSLVAAAGRRVWALRMERRHEGTWTTPPRLLRPVKRVLVLCYGNICRSPFAASRLQALRPDLVVEGAGFHEREGRRSPVEIVEAAAKRGLDLADHRSRVVRYEDLEAADLVLVMDRDQARRIRQASRDVWARTHFLGLFRPGGKPEIADPYGGGRDAAEQALDEIDEGIARVAAVVPPSVTGRM
ncbi:MAG: ATP-grasp domain-containing protein [Myxococcales bacterium]|nr:ATP-grasp domain-containing protein [Myxococcales bacterium]